MHQPPAQMTHARFVGLLTLLLMLCVGPCAASAGAQTQPAPPAQNTAAPLSPMETVRAFYKALGERRFREAFAMSIYRPAVEGLSQAEFEELRPDFERIAATVSEQVEISGEQVSGDEATVFVRAVGGDDAAAPQPVTLLRDGGAWVVGSREDQQVVKRNGKEFFFRARIDAHQSDVEEMMKRILVTELIYSSQHGGQFGDLNALVGAGLVPKDLLGTESTGYRFHVTLGRDGKSFAAGAEPERYGRTGRLSYYADQQSGLKQQDAGGKPLKASSVK